jgi:hypothetical protein
VSCNLSSLLACPKHNPITEMSGVL